MRRTGTKQTLPASYRYQQMAYAWGSERGRLSGYADKLFAGGCAEFMETGKHSRRMERRWAPRYSFRADLEIEWGSAVLSGKTRDISANGMFIEAADTLWIGAGFTARLNLGRLVKVNCFVKRVEPGLGMGVAVAHPESENQKYYQDLLDSLAGNRPDAAL